MSNSRKISEMIMINTSKAWDEYRRMFEKGLSVELVDAENKLSDIEDRLESMRSEYCATRNQVNVDNQQKLNDLVKKAHELKDEYKTICLKWDRKMEYRKVYYDVPTDAEATEEYIRLFVDKMTLNELFTMEHILQLMLEDQGIYWPQFVKMMTVVLSWMAYRTPNDKRFKRDKQEAMRQCLRFKEMYKKLMHEANAMPIDNNIYGDIKIDIENVLDKKWAAESMVDSHPYLTVEEAYSMIYGSEEEMFNFNVSLEDTFENDNYDVEDLLFG